MNNLKRILSLALASVMVIGMMVVGASAAEFKDADTITNTDAVDTLTSLGIIGGYAEDNTFRPTGDVTRAQMAKMIAVALNGGNEDFRGSSTGSQFVDVKDGLWYVKFINFCASKGIINGVDATHFNPEANVTAQDAAVMIMRTMGYRNETFLGENSKFSYAVVNDLAEGLGLYNDTAVTDTSKAVDRENAAQIIYNSLQLKTPEYTMSYNSEGIRTWTLKLDSKGQLTGKSILESAFSAETGYAILEGATYNSKTETFTYNLATSGLNTELASKALTVTGLTAPFALEFKQDATELFKQRVKVIHSGKTVLSITAAATDVVTEGVYVELDADKYDATDKKLDGYECASNTIPVYTFNNATALSGVQANTWTGNGASTYKLIDNTGDGKVDCMVIDPINVGQISYVGTTSFTVNGVGSYTTKNVDVYEGFAAKDWVVVSTNVKGVKVTKAEDVSGTIDAFNGGDVRIGGAWYSPAANALAASVLNRDYKLVMVNGYYVAGEDITESAAATTKDILYVTAVDYATSWGKTTYKAQAVFTNGDGKIQEIEVNPGDGYTSSNFTNANWANRLYYVSDLTKGVYTLTEIKKDSNGDYPDGSALDMEPGAPVNVNWDASAKALSDGTNTYRLDDNAVVLVAYNDGTTELSGNGTTAATTANLKSVKLMTGADVKAWGVDYGDKAQTLAYVGKINNLNYVKFLFVVAAPKTLPNAAATDNAKWGYVVSSTAYQVKDEDNKTYNVYTVWNGEAEVEVKDTNSTAPSQGDVVYYVENTDGSVTSSTKITDKGAVIGQGLDTDGKTTILNVKKEADSTEVEYKMSDKTVVLYIDSANKKGATGAGIQLATKLTDAGNYAVNAMYIDTDGDKVLDALVFDVSGKLAGTNGTAFTASMIKLLPAGAYKSDVIGKYAPAVSSVAAKELITIVYKAQLTTAQVEFKVWKTSDTTKENLMNAPETMTLSEADTAEAAHYFVIDGCGQTGIGHNSVTKVALEAGVNYTYEISGGGLTTPITGTFTW